ncbi:hypothetical protein LZQ00_03750 [Sphingobacterium sp. SRCM116780]|uniref:hypothetical protein n=1 Tax=Sphingobacterium sp. SRCM116780 TaxID=2907623 RepID=UPI001F2C7C42|nr:hypothetical protein [Sphingobacterium sp. SRCM116780]UIR56935.1 hypothetical protein LZQ00_03750 [Sphingobacterium sp. SRCM116780]
MGNFNHILIFKTNIATPQCKDKLQPVLDQHEEISLWTIDQDDCDCVLRIESNTLSHQQINTLINQHGYDCCELTY